MSEKIRIYPGCGCAVETQWLRAERIGRGRRARIVAGLAVVVAGLAAQVAWAWLAS